MKHLLHHNVSSLTVSAAKSEMYTFYKLEKWAQFHLKALESFSLKLIQKVC